jgi:acetyltransferase-like isoleucine patch superfamily enzyme
MAMLKKIKKLFKIIWKLNVINCIRFNIFRKHSGYFLPYKNSYYNIHKNTKIIINNRSIFEFNKHDKVDPFSGLLNMDDGAQLIVNGNIRIMTGGRISIYKNAILELESCYINHNVFLICRSKIKIGYGTAISNNVVIRDNDAHKIIYEEYVSTKPVEIGSHVWIGTNVTILKGIKIGDGAVVGANSLVNKDIPAKCLAAGVPAKIIKENIEWDY